MLRFYQSNRLEDLAAFFAKFIQAIPLSDAFQAETIVIQSAGIRRWLSLALVQQNGIAANLDFVTPAEFSYRLMSYASDSLSESNFFTHDKLRWRLFELLPTVFEMPEFMASQEPSLMAEESRFYLAHKLADLFESYLVYRLDWLNAWQNGKALGLGHDEVWQAYLWKQLTQQTASPNNLEELVDRLGKLNYDALPTRITIFGVMHLAPSYFNLFKQLAHFMDVYGFLFNPCCEYWCDMPQTSLQMDELSTFSAGDLLLKQLGRKGSIFLNPIVLDEQLAPKDLFQELTSHTLLEKLQNNILMPSHMASDFSERNDDIVADQSITLQVAHSSLRELEILKNQLLNYLASDPTLTPADILVLAPNIEIYIPFIDAVFSVPTDKGHIPYKVILSAITNNYPPLLSTLIALVDLVDSRFVVSDVLQLLHCAALRRRFNFSENDLDQLNDWIDQAMIRWGRDATHRGDCGFSKEAASSWRFGLDRLLLGALLPNTLLTDEEPLFAGLLPVTVRLADLPKIAQLSQLFDELNQLATIWQKPTDIKGWAQRLNRVCDTFFTLDETENASFDVISQILSVLIESQAVHQLIQFGLPVFRAWLKQHLFCATQRDFLGGTLTFSTMHMARGIPFKIICLIGLDNQSFPSPSSMTRFNLMAQHPRYTDCTTRDDDCYLFLTLLLSARKTLYLSWVGYTQYRHDSLPASVFIEKLLEALEKLVNPMHLLSRSFDPSQERIGQAISLNNTLTMHHPLQPFSSECHRGHARPISFDMVYRDHHMMSDHKKIPFLWVLPDTQSTRQPILWDDFLRFWRLPIQAWLHTRLHIKLAYKKEALVAHEPLTLDSRTRYQLQHNWFLRYVAQQSLSVLGESTIASGILPPGKLGAISHDNLRQAIENLVLPQGIFEKPITALPYEIRFSNNQYLVGTFHHIQPRGLFYFYPYAKLSAKHAIKAWLNHLVINAINKNDFLPNTTLIGFNQSYRFLPLKKEEAMNYLNQWISWYLRGLNEPLPFFPRTSLRAALALASGKSHQQSQQNALDEWISNYKGFAESNHAVLKLVFHQDNVLDDKVFWQLIESLLTPLAHVLINQKNE